MTRPVRILLIEDNAADAYLIEDTLHESCRPLEITVLGDGEQAVDYLLRRSASPRDGATPRPDLVLLDLNLPKVSGHEVLRQARQSPELRGVPIVVVTSSDAAHDVMTSYALGANCYVTKPVELDAFQTAVGAIGTLWCRVAKLP